MHSSFGWHLYDWFSSDFDDLTYIYIVYFFSCNMVSLKNLVICASCFNTVDIIACWLETLRSKLHYLSIRFLILWFLWAHSKILIQFLESRYVKQTPKMLTYNAVLRKDKENKLIHYFNQCYDLLTSDPWGRNFKFWILG